MGSIIKVVIADDHPIFREGLKQIVETNGIKIIAEASNGEEAFEKIREHLPDVVVLDINMPVLDGLEVLGKLRESKINVKTVYLTGHKNEKIFNRAMDLGAYGYVLKENASMDLIDCINKVFRGEYYISPVISDLLINRNRKRKEFEVSHPGIYSLTEAEIKVLKKISQSKSSREIADEMFVSIRTIEKHRENIAHKLNLHGSNALLKFALDNKSSL